MRLLVVGGGAAGFFCAANAARINPGLDVVIVEKSSKLLSKVRISGGGRCNVTHACFDIAEMIKKYPRGRHFVKKTFYNFFTTDTISWFKERDVLLKTETDGRMFPVTNSSETIIQCLLRESDRYGVKIRMNREARSIEKRENNMEENKTGVKQHAADGPIEKPNGKFRVAFADGTTETADFVCIACGGYPKLSMFEWIVGMGHTVQSPVPSLFTFNMPGNTITGLMGIAADVKIKIKGTKLEESGPVLITHWGLSGPAVLKLSAMGARILHELAYRFEVIVNWTLTENEQQVREKLMELRDQHPARKITGGREFGIPQRLWEYLCEKSGVDTDLRWGSVSSAVLNRLAQKIAGHELQVEGKTTFKEEFVTAGGVDLSEVEPQTMESRLVPGLYFAGEIIDVDGITGGFNFQHAWTSGWIAAKSIAERAK